MVFVARAAKIKAMEVPGKILQRFDSKYNNNNDNNVIMEVPGKILQKKISCKKAPNDKNIITIIEIQSNSDFSSDILVA